MTAALALESILIFSVGSNHFCAAMRQIISVLDYQPLSTLPNTPAHVAGGFWYHGNFAHVVNVRKKFALPDRNKPDSGSFITTHIDNELLAFWVDRIEDVTDASKYRWQKLPALNTGVFSRALFRNQKIVLEVNFEKLKNTDSLNIVNLVKTLSICNPATKQSDNTDTVKTQTLLQPHSGTHTIDNSTTRPRKRKNRASAASATTHSAPSKTTAASIINKQAYKKNHAEKENIYTKTDNTRDTGKPVQTAPKHAMANKYENTSLNIAPILLLISMISALLFFTFGSYFEKNLEKIFNQPPTETLIKTLTPSSVTQNTLGNKPDNNILFIYTVVKGDTLWHIAKRYRDNPYLYPELANLSKIRDPNLIYPGDTVTIKKHR